jgi:hypothetical protein
MTMFWPVPGLHIQPIGAVGRVQPVATGIVELYLVAVGVGPARCNTSSPGKSPRLNSHARRVLEGPVDDQVRPGGDETIAQDRVIARPASNDIGSRTAIDVVVARTAINVVVAVLTIDGVVTVAAIDGVIQPAGAIVDRLVRRAFDQLQVSCLSGSRSTQLCVSKVGWT